MSVTISVRSDWFKLRDTLDDLGRRQLPFATARALTETARAVQREIAPQLTSMFDRPTMFTQHAIGIAPARKNHLEARVFVKDVQARYLAPSIVASRQLPWKKFVVVPKNAPLNAFGNIPRGTLRKWKADPNVFIGTVHGVSGIWRRLKRGGPARLQLLVRFTEGVVLPQRFPWPHLVREIIERTFPRQLGEQLAKALATAKR